MKTNLLEGRVVVEKVDSKINGELAVVKDIVYGTYIHGGGLPQSGGLAETIWRKSLTKIKDQKPKVRRCLIVGLGGGSIAKLVRKNWPDAKITGVDIDPVMVKLGEKYLGLGDQSVDIIITDAYDLIENDRKLKPESFDLICFDTYVGDSFPDKFERVEFIRCVKKLLLQGGIAIFNRLYGPEDRAKAIAFEKTLLEVFKTTERLYPEANVMFVCSK